MNTPVCTQGQLFFTPIDTKMAIVLAEAEALVRKFPDILRWIDEDLDAYARMDKALRIADERYAREQTLPLPLERMLKHIEAEINPDDLRLLQGRPRTKAIVVYFFMVLRGHFGSISSESSWQRFEDSLSLRCYLDPYLKMFPGRTTLLVLINAITERTRSRILDAQLAHVTGCGLDDFRLQTIDSTGVHANSAWPRDVELIQGFLERAFHLGRSLDAWEVKPFNRWHCERWLEELQSAKVAYLLNKKAGKKKQAARRYITTAHKLLTYLDGEADKRADAIAHVQIDPSRRVQLKRLWRTLTHALCDAGILLDVFATTIVSGSAAEREEHEKIYSLSDGSAAFIIKGGRKSIFGYKIQLGRSANGFISAVNVPLGNEADSSQLIPMVKQHIERTDVIPESVSADDGYASQAAADYIEGILGVDKISISGSKGRRQLGDELWSSESYAQLRRDRSAVESLMSVGKHSFAFGAFHRRGLDAVREEMLEKVLAYNFWRIHHERTRQAAEADAKRRRTA